MVVEKSATTAAIGTTATSTHHHPKRDTTNLKHLNLAVPNLFRCPISMDVMKSPVSLCTGVTYDRASIQTWLSQGHNTCPATMQVLPSTDFVPNLTLRRLIHLYHQQILSSSSPEGLSPASSLSSSWIAGPVVVSRQEALRIVRNLASGEESSSASAMAASRIVDFVRLSEENRRFIAGTNGSVGNLAEVLRKSEDIEVCGRVMVILELILPANGVKESLNKKILSLKSDFDYLSKLAWIFRKGSLDSRIASAKVLESIALDGDSQREIAEKEALLYEIHRLGEEATAASTTSSPSALEASLSALISVSTSRAAKKELLRLGIIRTAARVLSWPEESRAATEKAMEALVSVARCTEGRSAIGGDRGCVEAVVRRLMKCSAAATEHGVMVLWSLCCLARDRASIEAVGEINGGLTKVLLVMQSDCSDGVRGMCGELVKVLRTRAAKDSKSCLARYDSRTTHIMPY